MANDSPLLAQPSPPESGAPARSHPLVQQYLPHLSWAACFAIFYWFFWYYPAYGPEHAVSALRMLVSSWNPETRYEHGFMFPFIIIGIMASRWKQMRAASTAGELWGILPMIVGTLLFMASYRVSQWRIAVAALPFFCHGLTWCLCGRKTANIAAFPLYYFWLAIPLTNIQHATVPLQVIATQLSQAICSTFGVQTYAMGAKIFSTTNKWAPLEIDEACSGIRSLMALIMISAAWAYLAPMALWKKACLLLSAIPLSIIGNGLRVSSIFIIAEYGDSKFARETWHDQSGLLIFYPITLSLMMLLHSALEGQLPWRKKVIRRTVQSPAQLT